MATPDIAGALSQYSPEDRQAIREQLNGVLQSGKANPHQIASIAQVMEHMAKLDQPDTAFQYKGMPYSDMSANAYGGLKAEASGLVSSLEGIADVVNGVGHILIHPFATLSGEGNRMIHEGQSAWTSVKKGNYLDALSHALAINPLEPPIEQTIQTFRKDPARAVGQVAGAMLLQELGGRAVKAAGGTEGIVATAKQTGKDLSAAQAEAVGLAPKVGEPPPSVPTDQPAARIMNSIARTPRASYDYGLNPGEEAAREVASGSIKGLDGATSLADHLQSANRRLNEVGETIGGVIKEADPTPDIKIQDAINGPINDRMAKATTPGEVSALKGLQGRLNEIIPDEQVNPQRLFDIHRTIADDTDFKPSTREDVTVNAARQEIDSNLRSLLSRRVPETMPWNMKYANLVRYTKALDNAWRSEQSSALPGKGPEGAVATLARHTVVPQRFQIVRDIWHQMFPESPEAALARTSGDFSKLLQKAGQLARDIPSRTFPEPEPWQRSMQFSGTAMTGPLFEPQVEELPKPAWYGKIPEGPPAYIEGGLRPPNVTFTPQEIQALRAEGQPPPRVIDKRAVKPKAGEIEYKLLNRSKIIHPRLIGELPPEVPPNVRRH